MCFLRRSPRRCIVRPRRPPAPYASAARPLATTVPTRVTLEASDHIVGVPCETFARAAPFVDGLSRRPEAIDVSSRLGGAVLARWWCGAGRAGKRLGATERVGENFEVFKRATRVIRRTRTDKCVLFWPSLRTRRNPSGYSVFKYTVRGNHHATSGRLKDHPSRHRLPFNARSRRITGPTKAF